MKNKMDRRNILKGAAVTIAAVTVGEESFLAQTPTPTPTPTPSPSPQDIQTSQPTLEKGTLLKQTGDELTQVEQQSNLINAGASPVAPLNKSVGLSAFQREETEWQEISQRLESLYSITENNSLSGNLQPTFLPIDYGFKEYYAQTKTKPVTKTFRPLHVEFL